MSRWMLLPMLALAACIPDETGYLDDDAGGLDTDVRGNGGLEDDPSADLDDAATSAVLYTAEEPLGDVAVEVTFVAFAGSFADARVTLSVSGGVQDQAVALVDGGFVTRADAALGATVTFDSDGVEVARLVLDGDLGDDAGLSPPEGTDTDSDTDGFGSGGLRFGPVVDGALAVGDGSVLGASPPYLAYVVEQGVAVRVDEGETDVTLVAAAGDVACVAAVDDATGAVGRSSCETLVAD